MWIAYYLESDVLTFQSNGTGMISLDRWGMSNEKRSGLSGLLTGPSRCYQELVSSIPYRGDCGRYAYVTFKIHVTITFWILSPHCSGRH